LLASIATAAPPKKNVLFVAVDDLRIEIGCYGAAHMKTPNIDRLAEQGLLFEQAYCQQAICGPSRISILTSYRPDSTKIYTLDQSLKNSLPDVMSMPRHFKENGYKTVSLGKIYHHQTDDKPYWDVLDSCSRPAYANPETAAWVNRKTKEGKSKKLKGKALRTFSKGPAYECGEVSDSTYTDGVIADLAIQQLRAKDSRPLFLAIGFKKPHLPFVAPKKYWDLYNPSDITVPSRERPSGAPDAAFTAWGELRAYRGMPEDGYCTDEQTRTLIQAYRACVSYVDAQLGRVLDELDKQGLRNDTIIVLWGDHGWKLGDYGTWCKHTNFELDTHVPLIYSGPGIPRGARSKALVEYVDIYPTLADWCGLSVPDHCEGLSMLPLFSNPAQPWKKAAFSQYPRGGGMGYTVRSKKWRYTEWRRKDGRVTAHELYDHSASDVATANLAERPEFATVLKEMQAILRAGPKGARP
jgi:iduronate 2-sulfatase